MDEKRFRRRDAAPPDRSTEAPPADLTTDTPPAEPEPRLQQVPRPRRMPVLGATPTAMPTNLRTAEPESAEPESASPEVGGPSESTPEPQVEPSTNGNGSHPVDESSGGTPQPQVEPSTNGNGSHPVDESSNGNGARPVEAKSAGSWARRLRQGPVAIPPQRQPEPEPPTARTEGETPPSHETEKRAPEPTPDERPTPTYVDQRPEARHVDERPAPTYVDQRPEATYVDERPTPTYVDQRPAATYVDERPAPTYVDRTPEADKDRTGGGDGGDGGDGGETNGGGVKGAWARRPQSITLNWKSLGAILVAIGIVFWLAKGFVGGPTGQESTPKSSQGQKVAVPKEKTHLKRVVIDGNRIRAAGPLVTLNPALAQPGAMLSVTGSGFDPGSSVDIIMSTKGGQTGTSLGSGRTDRTGNLNAQVTVPDDIQGGKVVITAKERNSDKIATAEAATAAGMGFAKLSKTTGKPGDTIAVSARGFAPGEKINVYWGRASGKPTSTIQAGDSGTVSQAPIRVGVGQVGEATLVLVGQKSGTTATVPFYMLGLYPTAKTAPYALKAGEDLSLSANGFAPNERVLIYVNEAGGTPAMTAETDGQGNIGGLGFKVPFGLRGSQSVVMVGEQSRASVSSGFQVLPYTPSAQTSTYGGSPGTSFSFFAKGFAPNEVVLVYLGRTKWDAGELVSAFRVNDRGDAGAAGNFEITTADQGSLNFTLIGRKSGGRASTSLKVTPATGAVDNMPQRQPYHLPRSLGGK